MELHELKFVFEQGEKTYRAMKDGLAVIQAIEQLASMSDAAEKKYKEIETSVEAAKVKFDELIDKQEAIYEEFMKNLELNKLEAEDMFNKDKAVKEQELFKLTTSIDGADLDLETKNKDLLILEDLIKTAKEELNTVTAQTQDAKDTLKKVLGSL